MVFRWEAKSNWAAAVVCGLSGDRRVYGSTLTLSGVWTLLVSSQRCCGDKGAIAVVPMGCGLHQFGVRDFF